MLFDGEVDTLRVSFSFTGARFASAGFSTRRGMNTVLDEKVLPTRVPVDISFCARVAGVSFAIIWQETQTLALTSKWFSPLMCEWQVVQLICIPSTVLSTCLS